MEKKKLFENESDSEEEVKIQFNDDYAKSYNKLKQIEFIKKLKDQDRNSGTSSDESDSTEDEEIDPQFDKEFFKTLSSLKSKDPKIYDKSTRFFENLQREKDLNNKDKSIKSKPLTLKDYERKIILEKEGKFEDDSEDEVKEKRCQSPSYVEEQAKIKSEIYNILKESDEDEEGFDSVFKKRVKSKDQDDEDEEDYLKWLTGQKEQIEEVTEGTLKPLKQYWDNPKLPRNEKFLRDYVLNKGYIDTQLHEIPTYEEIIGRLSDDENELEKQAEFEYKYNFRYEEPDQEFIKRYPRTIENSVRRTDDSRKKKRQEAKERRQREKNEKMKELEMLKELKKQEITEKISKLKEVTGNDDLPFQEDDLESEFDPEAHDRRMQQVFNDEYYQIDEGEEKPDCPDIEELKIEDWDNFDPNQDTIDDHDDELNCENADFNMDCDYNPNTKEKMQKELIESARDKRKRRRRNKFMEMIKSKKPAFDPEDEKTYAEYIDEYYKMDCEDFIGDTPCRFKYVECEPNDFGLTIEEILLAKNKELNQWASLKKAVQIRPSHLDKKERRIYQMKAKNEALKKKIFRSLYGEQSDEEDEQEQIAINQNGSNESNIQNNDTKTETKTKRKKKKSKSKKNKESVNEHEIEKDNTLKSENKYTKSDNKQISNDSSENIQNEIKDVTENKMEFSKQKNKVEISSNLQKESKKSEAENVNNPKKIENNKYKISKINSNASKVTEFKNKEKILKRNKFNKNINISTKSKAIFKNKFKQFHTANNDGKQISDERLKAYGLNPRKFHKKGQFSNYNKKKIGGNEKNKKENPFL